jgi:phosphoglycolate phosphatase
MYNTVLFDLDGTLTDPAMGITNSVAYALKKWNIEVKDRSELLKFIGPPLLDAFSEEYGFSAADSKKTLDWYREYFGEKGIYENVIYNGIDDMLRTLKSRGKRIVLATSKPEEYAIIILKHFDIYKYFDFVAGATMDESIRSKKADVIKYALDSCGITDVSDVVMVGDREHDVIGAKQFGIDTVGVLYGYGNREELTAAGAKYIAEKVEDILTIV